MIAKPASVILNWAEISAWAGRLHSQLAGVQVDSIVIPARSLFPEGYLKGEWALRLRDRAGGGLAMSVRPHWAYVTWVDDSKIRPAREATRSAFIQTLKKLIEGQRIKRVESIIKERIIIFWFDSSPATALVMVLIPSTPNAYWVEKDKSGLKIIARARGEKKSPEYFEIPDGKNAPESPPYRPSDFESIDAYGKRVELALSEDALKMRFMKLESILNAQQKNLKKGFKMAQEAERRALVEPQWAQLGEYLKASLHDLGPWVEVDGKKGREVLDYSTGNKVFIEWDPKVGATAQVERLFQLGKRKTRRLSEAQVRLESAREDLERVDKMLATLHADVETELLVLIQTLEKKLGIETGAVRSKRPSREALWPGRRFVSQSGWAFWVGRDRDENLELTFKCAKGNDLWLHLRGKPGSHAIIPIMAGKSAPLDVLLDAAALTVYYSGGADWGKTEVDYTFRKFVKRIKGSSEVSYSQNKTLLVEPDPTRIQRLLSQDKV